MGSTRAHDRISQASHAPDTRGLSEGAVHGEQRLHLRTPIVAGPRMVRTPVFTENSLHRYPAHAPWVPRTGLAPMPVLRRQHGLRAGNAGKSERGSRGDRCMGADPLSDPRTDGRGTKGLDAAGRNPSGNRNLTATLIVASLRAKAMPDSITLGRSLEHAARSPHRPALPDSRPLPMSRCGVQLRTSSSSRI